MQKYPLKEIKKLQHELKNIVCDTEGIPMKLNASQLQILIYLIFSKRKRIDAYMEYPVNDNYIDIFIKENKYNKHNIMIELKYLKKKESNLSDSVMKEAIEQVKSYTYEKEINKYAVVFIGSNYKLEEV